MPGQSARLAREPHPDRQSNFDANRVCCSPNRRSTRFSIDVAGAFGRDLSAQASRPWLRSPLNADQIVSARCACAVKKSSRLAGTARLIAWRDVGCCAGGQPSRKNPDLKPIVCIPRRRRRPIRRCGHGRGAWESGERAADAALRKIGA